MSHDESNATSKLPNWEGFMLPTLRALEDGQLRNRSEIYALVATHLALSPEQTQLVTASGQKLHQNRNGWAISYLTNVGALDRPSRGTYSITPAGNRLITQFPHGIVEKDFEPLTQDPQSGIRQYVGGEPRRASTGNQPEISPDEMTPHEQLNAGIERIRADVAADLTSRLLAKEPAFFEHAVVELLLAMGYGGENGRGTVTQLTGDGGIDGVIDQDILGLRRVYIQAKRYAVDRPIQRPDVQAFIGAVHGNADAGVFITTSRFSPGAREFARNSSLRITLVDGRRLTDLMIRFHVGVQVKDTIDVVEIDEDFFA